jgi:hypothetical protein
MKTKLALSAVAAAVAVFSQGAFAQAASSPTRAEVKAEAKAKGVTPAGEKPTPQPSTMSDKTRAERKATTRSDKAAGELKQAGEVGSEKQDKAMKSTGTETNRAERKAKTKAAEKSGEIPTGEKDQKKP